MPKRRNEIAGHKSGTGRNGSAQQGQRICSDVTESMQPPSQPSTHSSPPTRSEPTGRPCYKHSRDDWLDVMTTCHCAAVIFVETVIYLSHPFHWTVLTFNTNSPCFTNHTNVSFSLFYHVCIQISEHWPYNKPYRLILKFPRLIRLGDASTLIPKARIVHSKNNHS